MASALWTQTESPAVAQTLVYTLKNSSVTNAVQLTPTVAPQGTGSLLSAPVPSALLVPGSFTVTATNAFGSVVSDPFVGAAPSKPGTFVIS